MPRTFRFRLQKVLDYRELVEERLKVQLAELEMQRAALQAHYDALGRELVRSIERLTRGSFDVVDIQMTTVYIDRVESQRARLRQAIAEMDERIEAKRAEVLEASRGRKIMEILRDNAREEHWIEFLREEQKVLDEMGTHQFHRMERERAAHSAEVGAP